MNQGAGSRILWCGFVATALWAIALGINVRILHGRFHFLFLRPFAFGVGLIAANVVTVVLALKIRRDYPAGSRMRSAWTLIAAAACCAIAYYLSLKPGWMGVGGGSLSSAGPIANGLFLLLLIAGLLAMRSAFADLGLGRLRRLDWLLILAIVAATGLLTGVRAMAPSPFPSPLVIQLQRFDPLVLAVCGITGICLLRISGDLQGGPFAVSLRYGGAFGLLRLAALLVRISPLSAIPWILFLFTGASFASDWLLTLLVYHRWRLTPEAIELERQYTTIDGRPG